MLGRSSQFLPNNKGKEGSKYGYGSNPVNGPQDPAMGKSSGNYPMRPCPAAGSPTGQASPCQGQQMGRLGLFSASR